MTEATETPKAPRRMLQPTKGEIRRALAGAADRIDFLEAELAAMRRERDNARRAARTNAICLAIVAVAACLGVWIQA